MTRKPLGLIAEARKLATVTSHSWRSPFTGRLRRRWIRASPQYAPEHDPAHEVAAVAIGPEDEDRDERPHPAAAFQNRHGDGQQNKGDEEGPALLEVDGHRAGGQRAGEAAIEAGGAPPHHQPHERAEGEEEEGPQEDQSGEAGGRVDDVHEDLRQPLMRQVEVACLGFVRVGGAVQIAGVGEGVGHGERAGFESVAARHQVKPDIGVAHFAGKPGKKQNRGEREQERMQPCGRGGWDRRGGFGTSGARGHGSFRCGFHRKQRAIRRRDPACRAWCRDRPDQACSPACPAHALHGQSTGPPGW